MSEPDLILTSPYVLVPCAFVRGGLEHVLAVLSNPRDLHTDPYWATPLGEVLLSSRRYVVGEFYRRLIDGSFQGYPLPRRSKGAKRLRELVDAEVDLLGVHLADARARL